MVATPFIVLLVVVFVILPACFILCWLAFVLLARRADKRKAEQAVRGEDCYRLQSFHHPGPEGKETDLE